MVSVRVVLCEMRVREKWCTGEVVSVRVVLCEMRVREKW